MMWDEANLETLRRMWNDGCSAGEIGRTLKCTRSAVIGKVHRLRTAGEQLRTRPVQEPAGGKVLRPTRIQDRTVVRRVHPPLPYVPPEPIHTGSDGKPWVERRFGECAYPVSGTGADTRSCCLPTQAGRSYCPDHTRLMFAPNKANKNLIRATTFTRTRQMGRAA